MTVQLVDISNWNSNVDFAKLKAAGIDGVIHKATEGLTFVDARYAQRRREANAAGMPFGPYHFAHVDEDGAAQARHFLSVTMPLGFEIRPSLDAEHKAKGVTPAMAAAVFRAFDAAMDAALGYDELIYSYQDYLDSGYLAGLEKNPLWFARYIPGSTWAQILAKLPLVWRKRMVLWQSGQRQVPGASAGDGPGVDYDEAPSLAPLLVPRQLLSTEVDDVTPEDRAAIVTDMLAALSDPDKAAPVARALASATYAVQRAGETETRRIIDMLSAADAGSTVGLPQVLAAVRALPTAAPGVPADGDLIEQALVHAIADQLLATLPTAVVDALLDRIAAAAPAVAK